MSGGLAILGRSSDRGRRPGSVRNTAAVALAALVLTGCGGRSDGAAAALVVETYFDALSARDFEQACSLVTPSFKQRLTRYADRSFPDLRGRDCVSVARRIAQGTDGSLVALQKEIEVRDVRIQGGRATASLSGPRQKAELVRAGQEWRIDVLDFSGATGVLPPR